MSSLLSDNFYLWYYGHLKLFETQNLVIMFCMIGVIICGAFLLIWIYRSYISFTRQIFYIVGLIDIQQLNFFIENANNFINYNLKSVYISNDSIDDILSNFPSLLAVTS